MRAAGAVVASRSGRPLASLLLSHHVSACYPLADCGQPKDNQLPHAPIVRDIASYNKVGGALLAAVTGSKAPDAAPDCLSRPAAWAPLDTPYLCHT